MSLPRPTLRRREKQASPDVGLDLFERVSVAHLCHVDADGPHVRPLHPVVWDGRVWFHGAAKGEKTHWIERQAVLTAHEIVAEVPSTAFDDQRACPATTWFRSAEVRGRLVSLDDPEARAQVLNRLMARYQPEGGYRPLAADDPLYTAAIRGIAVTGIEGPITTKVSLGQALSDDKRNRAVSTLWRRGASGVDAAIESIWQAAPPGSRLPDLLQGPSGCRLLTRIPDHRVSEAVDLVEHEYWNVRWTRSDIARAMLGCVAFVGAEREGRIVATARAMTDRGKLAYIGDVGVHADLQRSGIGTAVMRLLLDHPAIRSVPTAWLRTRDAQGFYARLGFGLAKRTAGVEDLVMRR